MKTITTIINFITINCGFESGDQRHIVAPMAKANR